MRNNLSIICTLLLCLGLFGCSSAAPSAAQASTSAYVVVDVYQKGSATTTIAQYAPDNPTPVKSETKNAFISRVYSPDGKWIADFGRTSANTFPGLFYYQVGKPPIPIALDKRYTQVLTLFSPDSRYLAYLAIERAPVDHWLLGIMELASGKTASFLNDSNDVRGILKAESEGTLAGIPAPVGWSLDAKHLYVQSLVVSSATYVSQIGHVYDLDLSNIVTGNLPSTQLPPSRVILSRNDQPDYASPIVSPDGTQIAFLSSDVPPVTPPPKLDHPSGNRNVINILNVKDTQKRALTHLAAGNWIRLMTWSPDGKQLYYTSDQFNGADQTSAVLNSVNVDDGKVTTGATLTSRGGESEFSIMACANTVWVIMREFFPDPTTTATPSAGPKQVETLYSIPVANLASMGKVLATATDIRFLICAPTGT